MKNSIKQIQKDMDKNVHSMHSRKDNRQLTTLSLSL